MRRCSGCRQRSIGSEFSLDIYISVTYNEKYVMTAHVPKVMSRFKGLDVRGTVMEENEYLECEKPWVYLLLILAAGWFGAYTFLLRGGVFCNAQTANVVLFAMALGSGDLRGAFYLLIPISAYFLGAFVSEYMGKTIKKLHFLRWDTVLLGIEVIVVFILGLLPKENFDPICQVTLNFICSMQFNTYRQMQGVPAATTFVTNHIRQVGSYMAKYIRHRDELSESRVIMHGQMIIFFALGAALSTVCCHLFAYRSIWGSAIILLIVFLKLAHADRSYEKGMLGRVPHGH